MFDKIIKFSIENKLIIGILMLALIVWGTGSVMNLPIDAQPDITNNQVQIITNAPTLGAQEVEQFITTPIELAMANIPDVIERRSISRSGISVITIVFKDNADIYWARQQISQQLKEAESLIPAGLGEPSLAPITTGLGEVYHYVIRPAEGYEDKYNDMDLRTMQDWIVKRQLTGTEGIAEVSAWGGHVKQYEIALDNDILASMNVSIAEIYDALERNNENTGGSYIEQGANYYFIRGLGLVKTLDDIGKIVVRNTDKTPILIRDVATVQIGSAIRYGAVTRNGEGEVVAGITLMLKGENFSKVIANVKERMAQVQKSLPEGVIIEPFIDRTELVGRTTNTVMKNLLEGGLIVIFVLVLLLGNFRAGILVASVIPLSMLFAVGMMNIFGVSGNLMSLGAIDFGLIVDGAVIIVEAIVHRITGQHVNEKYGKLPKLSQLEMNAEVYTAASKIRNSAAFGEIIILIVYLPILTLVGIEGKMFRPMAQTVSFAILGAFILSLTYVPMMSALFLSKKTEHKQNFSDRLINAAKRFYAPVLEFSLRWKKTIVVSMIALLIASLAIFNRLGGEFIPTLEEGDLAAVVSVAQGTSLTQVIETFSLAERTLKAKFPEIKQAVTRIGSAEIPTDPMPIEIGDMMLSMKPKEEWTSARSREEMCEKMEETLATIPGIHVEISQPMEMRFNELFTGIRQDVAIKIFGDDIDVLAVQANKVAALIKDIEGVNEPFIEKVNGLPQIQVEYNRNQIARYGLSIRDVNTVLRTAFAGSVAGVVFEGDRRFDMVVRLKKELRHDLASIENLYIPLPLGGRIPLNQVATIGYKTAPAQIGHEDGQRRIYVGFNVRGRDIESTVSEIQPILDSKLNLPAGYYYTYGGEFQNLKEAKERLMIAVPAALLLIFALLFFTFHNVKLALLIFTAVPLSAIGGIAALWLRDMPFSISAGVGFIALFGVAVLNGIVLIGQFNQLKDEGITDVYERVRKGTMIRLRPVLMTALVASLGFLPMALSTSAGSEVQKPLASVVIGGLITATLLTLLVLPALYVVFERKINLGKIIMKRNKSLPIVVLLFVFGFAFENANAQETRRTLQQCIETAMQNNLQIQSANLEVKQAKALQGTAFNPDKTSVSYEQDPLTPTWIDKNVSITQSFEFPTVYAAQGKMLKEETRLAEKSQLVTRNEITKSVSEAYFNLCRTQQIVQLLQQQDSIYSGFVERATVRYNAGDCSRLELINAQSRAQENHLQLNKAKTDLQNSQLVLQKLLNTPEIILSTEIRAVETWQSASLQNNPVLDYYSQQMNVGKAAINVEQNKLLPDIFGGYSFNDTGLPGFQIGVSVPLFFGANRAKIKAAKIRNEQIGIERQQAEQSLQNACSVQYNEYQKAKESLAYYETAGIAQADEIAQTAQTAYHLGEIGYMEYIQNLQTAIGIKLQYADALNSFNQSIIVLNYLQGEN
ncbi:acriflavine resistance protein B [Bacteroidia bacterium]|nr:acriflavine resistance protein B [Bacteroidia bacterium]